APGKQARGLDAAEVAIAIDSAAVAPLAALVREAGGAPIGAYHEPLGGRTLLLASLPLNALQPTPFQRDLSPTHAKRLAAKIDETAAFLDPLIVVRGEDGRLWTPNGRHRLAAGKVLGLKQITALISPDESLAYRILALNTEKAHNLKDRSLEVIRMARNLAKRRGREREGAFAAEFEAPELLTLAIVFPGEPSAPARRAGGAASPARIARHGGRGGKRPVEPGDPHLERGDLPDAEDELRVARRHGERGVIEPVGAGEPLTGWSELIAMGRGGAPVQKPGTPGGLCFMVSIGYAPEVGAHARTRDR